MKLLFSIFLTFLLSTFLLAQDQAPAVELFFITEGAPTYPIIACTLTAQSQCWAISLPIPPQPGGYYLSDDYDNSIYVPTANNMGQQSAGFDFVTSMGGAPGTGYPDFAYGLYKLTISGSNKYFYLDYRDYRVGYYQPPINGHEIDLWIKYVYSEDKFQFSSHDGWIDYIDISNGQLLNIWDIKQKGNQQTNLFPDYWENCLAFINDGNDHPKLVWGPYSEYIAGAITGYKLYYANHVQGIPPTNFTQLAILESDEYSYIDNSITIGSGINSRSYYVKCVYEDQTERINETGPTNTVEVNIENPAKRSSNFYSSNQHTEFKLGQNYPNPFNPSTTINYTIEEDGRVTLKVFDILGNEIVTLINENKPLGNYQIEFNASEIPSGIYFYSLIAGNHISTKKLILLK